MSHAGLVQPVTIAAFDDFMEAQPEAATTQDDGLLPLLLRGLRPAL